MSLAGNDRKIEAKCFALCDCLLDSEILINIDDESGRVEKIISMSVTISENDCTVIMFCEDPLQISLENRLPLKLGVLAGVVVFIG